MYHERFIITFVMINHQKIFIIYDSSNFGKSIFLVEEKKL